ncbi:uncharacterized protein EV422DRAFT_604763 [Fimicolochytrium jonesii]|uniref:uncharacterized protein n=1 Tax=Fimicolochytrium jonesii TaxID=1396493 RepID=UPI0022FF141C|nr:uncharacterized protein EV422DRAFT_604763 [Fimicolochytrium jonesii]KAI8817222.1 hypothetical protein EV422DRAFT_604763 [Fimicolochytrium jonesii]
MGDDEAAKQDDFIAFDMDEELIDQCDGPVPTSSVAAHGTGTGGPANRRGPHNDPGNVHSKPRLRKPEINSLEVLTPLPIPPWQPKDRKYSRNLLKMLHEEIDDYISYLIPTEAGHAIDVDVVILDQTMHLPPIRQVKEAIRKAGIASRMECITGAKVPIIKMMKSITGYPANISVNVAAGMHATEIVKTFLNDPRCGEGLRVLLLIMKQVQLQRNRNEIFTSGIGGYTLMSIIAAFMRMHPRLQTGRIQAKGNLGVLLIKLLEFYGVNFNYEVVRIAMDMEGVWYFPKDKYVDGYPVGIRGLAQGSVANAITAAIDVHKYLDFLESESSVNRRGKSLSIARLQNQRNKEQALAERERQGSAEETGTTILWEQFLEAKKCKKKESRMSLRNHIALIQGRHAIVVSDYKNRMYNGSRDTMELPNDDNLIIKYLTYLLKPEVRVLLTKGKIVQKHIGLLNISSNALRHSFTTFMESVANEDHVRLQELTASAMRHNVR